MDNKGVTVIDLTARGQSGVAHLFWRGATIFILASDHKDFFSFILVAVKQLRETAELNGK